MINLSLIIGIVLIVSGLWILLSNATLKLPDDLVKTSFFSFFGTALFRTFRQPNYQNISGTSKKLYGIIFIVIGVLCIYASRFLQIK
ncbi:MAG TPA: hypothetical protein VE973_03460 [Candidatus Limnocylindria bacterium]|nr:hypothetical protein [Candidatus Limnocylindria bacterium]